MNLTLGDITQWLTVWATTKGVRLLIGIIMLLVGWRLIKNVLKIIDTTLKKRDVDITLLSFLNGFANIALKILLVVLVMGYVGIATTGIAAIVASAGLAVGLSLQGSLSNFAGGVIILIIRPFNVGDYIEASIHSGTVEKISIFYTYLVTPDNKQILIPNGSLANGSVINYSTKELRRLDLTFDISYSENISKVKVILSNIITTHKLIIDDPQPFVGISAYRDSSIEFVIKAWCKNSDYWTIFYDLLEQVKLRFDEEGIEIPYPQMDIHMKNGEKLNRLERFD